MNLLFLLRPKATVAYIQSNVTVRQGLEKMHAHGYTAIPVITPEGKYVGTVSEGDFLWAVYENSALSLKEMEKLKLSDIMREKRDKSVTVSATMDELYALITEQNFVPVTDDRGIFIGIVTRRDILKAVFRKEKENENEQ